MCCVHRLKPQALAASRQFISSRSLSLEGQLAARCRRCCVALTNTEFNNALSHVVVDWEKTVIILRPKVKFDVTIYIDHRRFFFSETAPKIMWLTEMRPKLVAGHKVEFRERPIWVSNGP